MKVQISRIGVNEKEIKEVKNIVEEIENAYWSGESSELRFYKKLYGYYSEVAWVSLIAPHEISLYKERLTESEVKKFVSIITKHLREYEMPFELTWRENR